MFHEQNANAGSVWLSVHFFNRREPPPPNQVDHHCEHESDEGDFFGLIYNDDDLVMSQDVENDTSSIGNKINSSNVDVYSSFCSLPLAAPNLAEVCLPSTSDEATHCNQDSMGDEDVSDEDSELDEQMDEREVRAEFV